MEGGDDLFVINDVEAEQAGDVPEARPAEQAPETEAEVMESVKGLVPLCTQHVQGPQLSGATFGYDIAQMAKRPWAEPGAKLSDYFNYGFNEKSWRVYCAMQENGEASLLAQATAMLQKLEHAGRSADEAAAAAGAGGVAATGRDEPPMSAMGGPVMEGYGGGPMPYGGPDGPGRGAGYGRPYGGRDFHGGFDRPPNANYKTRMCKSFAEGHCHRGEHCNFAHSAAELRPPGGGGGGGAPPQQYLQQSPGPAGGAPPPMGPGPGYGDRRQGFNNFYSPPAPSSPPGMPGGMGGATPQPQPQQQPPPQQQAPERANYLMPPVQGGAGMPPMMGPTMSMQGGREGGREGGGGGFRQPPKRQRHEGGGVYEPQY